jgi:poly(3-hydroxybutyrate) depolymerase
MRRAPFAAALLGALLVPAAASAAPAACATAGPAGTAYARGVNCRTVEVDGFRRRFEVYVPRTRRMNGAVVFMFHGSSGTGRSSCASPAGDSRRSGPGSWPCSRPACVTACWRTAG